MNDLDALLNSYKDVLDAHLSTEPVLSADTYASAEFVNPHDHVGDIYVGCVGKWLLSKGALDGLDNAAHRPPLDASAALLLTPQEFSIRVLGGKLYLHNIAEPLRPFASAYVRDTSAYSQDYMDVNVVAKLKTDMSEVNDGQDTYDQTAAAIDKRYAAYVAGNPEWLTATSHYQQVALTDSERSPDGWIVAFQRSAQRDSLPEKHRRTELNRFWALVDYAPEIASPEVVVQLLHTFNRAADSAVQQAVFNSLAAMPFALVMTEILNAAPTLEKSGWLPEILGSWGADFSDEQRVILEDLLDNADAEARNCVRRAASLPDYRRSGWAMQIQAL